LFGWEKKAHPAPRGERSSRELPQQGKKKGGLFPHQTTAGRGKKTRKPGVTKTKAQWEKRVHNITEDPQKKHARMKRGGRSIFKRTDKSNWRKWVQQAPENRWEDRAPWACRESRGKSFFKEKNSRQKFQTDKGVDSTHKKKKNKKHPSESRNRPPMITLPTQQPAKSNLKGRRLARPLKWVPSRNGESPNEKPETNSRTSNRARYNEPGEFTPA